VNIRGGSATARSEKRISITPNGPWRYGPHVAVLNW
jgi:hypothetical protein